MNINRFACIAIAVLCAGFLAGCGEKTPEGVDLEEDFLQQVRQEARSTGHAEADSGSLKSGGRNPEIELETDHFQMGTISYKAPHTSKMKIYNRGGSTLRISKITTTCSCTTGTMTNPSIPAGGVGIIDITVDPSRIQGFFTTKTLTLFTNDPVNPHTAFDVTTYVEAEAEFEPDEYKLGEIAKGEGAEVFVRIRQLNNEPLEIDAVDIFEDSPYFTAEVKMVPEAEWRTPGKREYVVTAKMLPETPPGEFQKAIFIHSNLRHQPTVALPIFVSVVN